MAYTLTISNLTAFEADHIGEILSEHKRKMIRKICEAVVEDHKDGGSRVAMLEKQLEWHDEIMKKVVWEDF